MGLALFAAPIVEAQITGTATPVTSQTAGYALDPVTLYINATFTNGTMAANAPVYFVSNNVPIAVPAFLYDDIIVEASCIPNSGTNAPVLVFAPTSNGTWNSTNNNGQFFNLWFPTGTANTKVTIFTNLPGVITGAGTGTFGVWSPYWNLIRGTNSSSGTNAALNSAVTNLVIKYHGRIRR